MKFYSIPLLLFYLVHPVISQAVLTPIENETKEIWYDRVPVSGEIRVGISNHFDDQILLGDTFFANIGEEGLIDHKLCALITTKDGRYKATLPYNLETASPNQMNTFVIELSKRSKIASYPTNEITILAKVAKNCNDDALYYTNVSWNNQKSNIIYIVLNADKKPALKIFDPEGSEKDTINCKRIEDDQTVAFNYVCELNPDKIGPHDQLFVEQRIIKIGRVSQIRHPLPLKIYR